MSDYDWSHETSIDDRMDVTAEEWLRATWEGGPLLLRVFLPLAWKCGLGLRLGSASDRNRILGWHIADSTAIVVRVEADSWLMRAENIISVDAGLLRWQAVVQHRNAFGRLMWIPAKIVHQQLVPWTLQRAIRLETARTLEQGGSARP